MRETRKINVQKDIIVLILVLLAAILLLCYGYIESKTAIIYIGVSTAFLTSFAIIIIQTITTNKKRQLDS